MWTTCQRGLSHWLQLWIPSHPQTHPRSSLKVSKWGGGGEGGRESENSPSCVAVLIRVYTNRPKEGSVAPVAVELALRAGVARRQQSLSRRPGWPPAKPHCIHSTLLTLLTLLTAHCSQHTAHTAHTVFTFWCRHPGTVSVHAYQYQICSQVSAVHRLKTRQAKAYSTEPIKRRPGLEKICRTRVETGKSRGRVE